MNSADDADWWSAQAGEYVLGTLGTSERKLFERVLHGDRELQAEVAGWEWRLQPLADQIPAEEPPARVWNAVALRIAGQAPTRGRYAGLTDDTTVDEPPATSISVDRNLGTPGRTGRSDQVDEDAERMARQLSGKLVIWQRVATLAIAASLLMAVTLLERFYQPARDPAPVESPVARADVQAISLVLAESGEPLWLVEVVDDPGNLRIVALAPPPLSDDSVHELWIVKPDDQGVQSLGLLPQEPGASRRLPIDESTRTAVAGAAALAVSLEPPGGSPAPAPTGPVLYQGSVQAITEDAASI